MSEKFVNSFIVSMSDRFSATDLEYIQMKLIQKLKDYDVVEKCTQLAVYEEIPEALKAYLVTIKIQGLSEGTIKQYARTLKIFFERCRKPVQEINSNDIKIFLYNYQVERGISNRTLDDIRTTVCTFMKWCACEGYLDKDPTLTIKPIKYQKKKRGYLSEEELEQVRAACSTLREKALIEFFYSTGCRVSEVVALNKQDIDFQGNEVIVTGKENKQRSVYINARCKITLQNYLKSRTDENEALFVHDIKPYGRLKVGGIEKIVKELGIKSGINKNVHPHLMRHTTGSHALQHGMPIENVRQILGHVSMDTTMIYAEVADMDVKMSHRKCIV